MTDTSLADLLKTLTTTQLDFVRARMFALSDKAAAEEAKIPVTTVYNWSNLADVRECVRLAKQDGVLLGAEELRRQVGAAVKTLADELKGRRGTKTRLDAANSILDRVGLDVKQTIKQQVEQAGTVKVIIEYVELDADGTPTATEAPPSAAPDR